MRPVVDRMKFMPLMQFQLSMVECCGVLTTTNSTYEVMLQSIRWL